MRGLLRNMGLVCPNSHKNGADQSRVPRAKAGGLLGAKQMHRSEVTLHLPAETRILVLINKSLALCGVRP